MLEILLAYYLLIIERFVACEIFLILFVLGFFGFGFSSFFSVFSFSVLAVAGSAVFRFAVLGFFSFGFSVIFGFSSVISGLVSTIGFGGFSGVISAFSTVIFLRSKIFFRHLSSRFKFVIMTLEG